VAETYETEVKVVKDQKLGFSATELRKWEVELPFDNITIGAFFDILTNLKETNGSIKFDQLRDALKDNATFYSEL
jgi:hypothetical protein